MSDPDRPIQFAPESVSVIDEEHQTRTTFVRLSKTIVHPPEATTDDIMNIVEASGALDFWNAPEEDKYNANDGDAV